MRDISKIDENFKVKTDLDIIDAKWFDCKEYLFGLKHDFKFRRMDETVAKEVSESVFQLSTNTAGGRVRFSTDSEYIAISCSMPSCVNFEHMPATGVRGFDLYVDNVFRSSFIPPFECRNGYESVIHLGTSEKHEIMIGFPLYNDVTDLYIGVQKNSCIEKSQPYKIEKPVVFYGSSITQGGCVSRPGISYPAILSRKFSFDYINLGFSGSCRGEETMAKFIASLEMSMFVYDYDHNAPTAKHLRETHEPFFKIIRKYNEELPVIMLSKPDFRFSDEEVALRREIIRTTFNNAVASGDSNVYFIDGETLWGDDGWDCCTGDALHPSDMGHYRMAERIASVMEEILSE